MGRIAAHLIIGDRDEPFLPAMLESIAPAVDLLIVNDNGPDPVLHTAALEDSSFGRQKRLIVDRTPFVNFAEARNVCLRQHRENDGGDWIAFIDADEIHGEAIVRVASHLGSVPRGVDFIDGYTWHFFQSFDWYTSIERRMMFFRFTPELRWERTVHERLVGLDGARLPLPYVYGHYGHVLPARRHALKGRQYSSLGWPGPIVAEDRLDAIDVAGYFSEFWPRLLRFRGKHPSAALPTIKRLRSELAAQFDRTNLLICEHQTLKDRWRNAFLKLNYEQRWRSRALNRLARRLLSN